MYRIMCEWCGKIIIGTGKKRFCCRLCQNRYLSNNRTEETKMKISESMKGRNLSEETKKKMSESSIGHNHSEETKRKMSESMKGSNNPMYGKHFSDDHKRKLSEAIAKNHRDGSKTRITEEYQIIANEYYEYKCCGCGRTDGKLLVHHIDGNHSNNDPGNLAWLCISCHGKVHPNRLRGDSSIDEEFTKLIIENRELN